MENPNWTEPGLGQADISFCGFQLWVHRRQFEDHQDYYDGNWLDVTVRYSAAGADVWVRGSFLHLGELEGWLKELEHMGQAMSGRAELAPFEPNLYVGFEMDKLGHIAVHVRITPEHMSQRHEFRDQIDQSYLPGLIRQVRTILQEYPIRGEKPLTSQPSDLASTDSWLGRLRSRWNSLWKRR